MDRAKTSTRHRDAHHRHGRRKRHDLRDEQRRGRSTRTSNGGNNHDEKSKRYATHSSSSSSSSTTGEDAGESFNLPAEMKRVARALLQTQAAARGVTYTTQSAVRKQVVIDRVWKALLKAYPDTSMARSSFLRSLYLVDELDRMLVKEEKSVGAPSKRGAGHRRVDQRRSKRSGGGAGDQGVVEQPNASFLLIRNDGGTAQVYRQYRVVVGDHPIDSANGPEIDMGAGTIRVQLGDLSPVRAILPGSTLLFGESENERMQWIDASLDGPISRPINNTADVTDLVGKKVIVAAFGNESNPLATTTTMTTSGTVVRVGLDGSVTIPIVWVWDEIGRRLVVTKFDRITLFDQANALAINWDKDPQTLQLILSERGAPTRLHLHYQIKRGSFAWRPQYMLVLNPDFKTSLVFKATAIVSNTSPDTIQTDTLVLRQMRESRLPEVTYDEEALLPRRMMAMSSFVAPQSTSSPSDDGASEKVMDEWKTVLPTGRLQGQHSVTVPLFTFANGPVSAIYELTIDGTRSTRNPWHARAVPPQWTIKLENTSEYNWPQGDIQIVLPGSLHINSPITRGDQATWLASTRLSASVARGQSTTLPLPAPWNLSLLPIVTIRETIIDIVQPPAPSQQRVLAPVVVSAPVRRVQVQSTIDVTVTNSDEKFATRFPLRLSIPIGERHVQVAELQWKTAGQPSALLPAIATQHREGAQWVVDIGAIPAAYNRVLQINMRWERLETITLAVQQQ